jgi:hypothetical protein
MTTTETYGYRGYDIVPMWQWSSWCTGIYPTRADLPILSRSTLSTMAPEKEEEVLRPTVIEVLDNAFAAAELGDAVLAAQPLQHNADLVFGRKILPRRPADILQDLFRRLSHRHGFLSLRSFERLR